MSGARVIVFVFGKEIGNRFLRCLQCFPSVCSGYAVRRARRQMCLPLVRAQLYVVCLYVLIVCRWRSRADRGRTVSLGKQTLCSIRRRRWRYIGVMVVVCCFAMHSKDDWIFFGLGRLRNVDPCLFPAFISDSDQINSTTNQMFSIPQLLFSTARVMELLLPLLAGWLALGI